MISIIICSSQPERLIKVKQNIDLTIGIDYEIIAIQNQIHNYGICKAYNIGAAKAKYDYLCFIHEDIKFTTLNWGNKLIHYFIEQKLDVVGIAGSTVKTKTPSPWWICNDDKSTKHVNIIQHVKNGTEQHHEYSNPLKENFSLVNSIDGVFIGCTKKIWTAHPFDEISFRNFHFYDLDFSFAIAMQNKVAVVYDILLEHFSRGHYEKTWTKDAIVFSQKWKQQLPCFPNSFNSATKKKYEFEAYIFFMNQLVNYPSLTFHFFNYLLSSWHYPQNIIFIKKWLKNILLCWKKK